MTRRNRTDTSRTAPARDDRPGVSVVIPTYEREDELQRLITSIESSRYPLHRIEVIVVDDAGTVDRRELFDQDFDRTKVISNRSEKLLSECRNQGLRAASNEYVLVIDDDNVIEERCLDLLVARLEQQPSLGAVAPFQYYFDDPDRMWTGGTRRNYATSTATEIDSDVVNPQRRAPVEIDDAPNAFMVRRSVAVEVCGFDSRDFPIEFEHSDFFARVSARGYSVEAVPDAIVYHDTPMNKTSQLDSEMKVYYRSRNRVLFQRRHAPPLQLLLFLLLLPGIVAIYVLKLHRTEHGEKIPILLKGFLDGILGIRTDWFRT